MSLSEKELFIARFPLFFLLSPKDIREFANILQEIEINQGVTIIHEGEIVDCVYLIARGTAEVTRNITTVEKKQVLHVASLGPGDAIGLSEAGFFSQSGIRTATVVSTAPMVLLAIPLLDLQDFLKKPGITYPGLKNLNEKILLMNFIQNSHLFGHFPKVKIQQLAKRVKKIKVQKNEIIFKQNEIADKCYFIIAGKVAITTVGKNNEEHVLKILEAPNLFGEGAFLDAAKRNATVRAEEDTELFVLERKDLDFIELDDNLIQSLNITRLKQIRPIPKANINIIKKVGTEGEEGVILDDVGQKVKLQLSHKDLILWSMLDGKKTLEELHKNDEFKSYSIQDMYTHILNMQKAGFLQFEEVKLKEKRKQSLLDKVMGKIRKKGNKR